MNIAVLVAVKEFITSLNKGEAAKIVRTLELLEQYGNNLQMPHSRHLSDGLLELRIRGKREIRIFYCFYNNEIFLLHAYIKKNQKLSNAELLKAREEKANLSKYII